jgi:general nucleoside transport system permease protein
VTVGQRNAAIATVGFISALIIGVLALGAFGYDPVLAFRGLWSAALADGSDRAQTLRYGAPLLLCGLSASLAFACGPVNLGQPGQFLVGAMAATAGGIALDLPAALQVPVLCILGAMGGGGLAAIAAVSKRRFGMDEFVVTLMLNFIADYSTQWLIAGPMADRTRSSPMTEQINRSGFLGDVFGINVSVLIAASVVVCVGLLLKRSTIGYEWRMAGAAPRFARFGGVRTEANTSWVLIVSGAIAGLGGALLVMSGPHRFLRGIGANYGWDGVMVAVVAANGLVATVAFAFVFAALQTGAIGMNLRADVPTEAAQILQATVVLMTVVVRGLAAGVLQRVLARRRLTRRPRAG